jgi:hypothetical protein
VAPAGHARWSAGPAAGRDEALAEGRSMTDDKAERGGGAGCARVLHRSAVGAAARREAGFAADADGQPAAGPRRLAQLARRSARPVPGAHGSGRLFSGTLIAERSPRSDSGSSSNRGMTCIWGCRVPPWFQPSR